MNRSVLILVFLALALVDLVAVLMILGRLAAPPASSTALAAGMHLLVAAIAIAAIRHYPGAKEHPGYKRGWILAGFLCLFVPFLGALASGWLVSGMLFPSPRRERGDRFVIGNPLNDTSVPGRPVAAPVLEPLAAAIAKGDTGGLWLAAPLIRSRRHRSTAAILRMLAMQRDAWTQIDSQSALATMLGTGDWVRANDRRVIASSGDRGAMERLAAQWVRDVEIGLATGGESEIVGEALGIYEELARRHPSDPAYLLGRGMCLVRLGRLDLVPDIYGRLCSLANAEAFADRLELSYFAAMGNWKRCSAAVERIVKEGNRIGLSLESRAFWLMGRAE